MAEATPPPQDRHAFGLTILHPSHPELRQLRSLHAPKVQGHRLWNATWLLLRFLEGHPLPPEGRVLEAGSGWGLSGIYCARTFGAAVTAVDVDPEVFPFLQLHACRNQVEIATLQAGFHQVGDDVLARHDTLIGADICFRDSMVQPLFGLVERALGAGLKRVIISDPGRLAFRSLASLCVARLNGLELEWQVEEPMLTWPGDRPRIHGRILVVGEAMTAAVSDLATTY